jgi:hypothetical protein
MARRSGYLVDGDHATCAEHPGALDGELTDRSAAPDGHRVAGLDLSVLGRHVASWKDVGQKKYLIVVEPFRYPDRPHVGKGNTQELGLASGVAAQHVE